MADIEDKVFLKGGRQHNDRPIDFHYWEVEIPTGVLTPAGGQDIITLPDTYAPGTRLLDCYVQQIDLAAAATSVDVTVRSARQVLATGVLEGQASLLSSPLDTYDTEKMNVPGGNTALSNWHEPGTELIQGVSVGKILFQIDAVGAYTTDTCKFLVALLLGRIEY